MSGTFDLGILFVHGIGEQKRGDTLLGFGEPLGETLTDWFGPDAVEWNRTSLTAPVGEAPANSHLTIDRGGRRRSVLVAESTWADSFNPPGYFALARWLWWAIPFVVLRATDHRLGMIGTNSRIDEHWSFRDPVRWLANHVWRLVKNVLSVVLVLVLLLALPLLGLIAVFPRLRASLLSVQRVLIRYIGDSYDLVVSPGRADAMVSQVEADLAWLEATHKGNVVIVAHSQGAELVRRVLERRPKGRPVMSLITFGSGIAKLRAVDRLRGRGKTALGGYALRTVAAGVTVAGVWLALGGGLWIAAGVVLAIVSAALITGARVVLKRVVDQDDLEDELKELVPGRLKRWIDFYATSDPVPEGRLPLEELPLKYGRSIRIANRRSPFLDHTSYFSNGEAFRPAVLAELSAAAGWAPTGLALRTIGVSRERRARATLRLLGVRLLLMTLAVAAIVLPLLDVGERQWDSAAAWLARRLDGLDSWFAGAPGRDLALGAAIVLAAAVLNGAYVVLWNRAAGKRGSRLFERAWPCEPDVVTSPVGLLSALSARIGDRVDRQRGWAARPRHLPWLLPTLRGTFVLYGLRVRLRQHNLYDDAAYDPPRHPEGTLDTTRKLDGTGTDARDPEMGAVGAHFGRNGPAFPGLHGLPAPADVADAFLARRTFLPAETLNLLAAAWIQFEVHDWMQHVTGPPRPEGMPPFVHAPRSRPGAPRFTSAQTHWWDASQLYGADEKFTTALRSADGDMKVGDDLLETIEQWMPQAPSPVPNLWMGVALFHRLFALEHNAICERLRLDAPELDANRRFDQARLINAAVMAKIHTVEWTPAVIAHPTTARAIHATWWGELGELPHRVLPRMHLGDVLSGIPGSRTRLDGVRYSLTEEFVAVYRMHPLIPDTVRLRNAIDGTPRKFGDSDEVTFAQLAATADDRARPRVMINALEEANAIYSLAVNHPGAISLRNYPQFLRDLRPADLPADAPPVDLAARDIARMRESAVPRYNDFRRMLRLEPCKNFAGFAGDDAELAAELKDFYGTVDRVDLMIGLFAERKPQGFAFSDTAFRIFLLMAARRLRSDRFFTTDFNRRVYTPAGLRWVRDRTLVGMLGEHFPALEGPLAKVKNPFAPWTSQQ